MSKSKTPTFILELEISFSDALLNELYPVKHKGKPLFRRTGGRDFLDRALSTGTAIYNSALGEGMKRLGVLKHDRAYQTACTRTKECREAGKNLPEEVSAMFAEARTRAGYSEYDLHHFIIGPKHHFDGILGIDECQKLASRAFQTVDRMLTSNARRVRFHHWYDDMSIEGKSGKSTLKYAGHRCIQFGKGRLYPLIIKKGDTYAPEALARPIKYVRIVRRTIRGKQRYYAQLVLEGIPPRTKNLKYGRKNFRVGLDEGTSTVAVVSSGEVSMCELAPGTAVDEKELRRLNRAMERSRRANNPDNYNRDGTIKKGRLKWNNTKHYRKLATKRRELFRKSAWRRRCSHNALANHIVFLGQDVRVEDMKVSALARRAKATAVNRSNGRIHSKKRYGGTIMSRAPAGFISAIDRKLSYIGGHVRKVNTWSVKASQYDHKSNTYRKKSLCERWGYIGRQREKVQRDLYSAFLIMNTNDTLDAVDRKACARNYNHFKEQHDAQVEILRKLDKTHTLHWYVA